METYTTAVAIANEGALLFKLNEHAQAAERFTHAFALLSTAELDADDQAVLARARALNNLASCHLALGSPIAALDDTADAIDLLCDRELRARGVPAVRSSGSATFRQAALAVMITSVRKRAVAYEAAGTPVSALPLVAWAVSQPGGREQLGNTLLALRCTELAPSAVNKPGVLAALNTPVKLKGRTGFPPGRHYGVGTVAAGHLYVLGGPGQDGDAVAEFWRMPLYVKVGSPKAMDWERLPSPQNAGGPTCTHHVKLCTLHYDSKYELVCLAECKVWTLQATYNNQDEVQWRCHGLPWQGAEEDGAQISGAAMTAVGHSALVYAPSYGLVSIDLRTSAREVLWVASPPEERSWRAPYAITAHLWPAGSSEIVLYGGNAPEGNGSTDLPGHVLMSPPPLSDMWRFDLDTRTWTRLPRGGGGAPPAPRAEAALTPLVESGYFEPGSAVLLGGYSELLQEVTDNSSRASGFRYCDDAHLYTPTDGWRRLAPAGPRASSAASIAAGAVHNDTGAAVYYCGGYFGFELMASYEQVTRLTFGPLSAEKARNAVPVVARAGPDRDAVLVQRALELLIPPRDEDSLQVVLPLPEGALQGVRHEDRPYNTVDWPALLARARALPRSADGSSQACVSFQETWLMQIATCFHMTISRTEDLTRRCNSTAFFFAEPTAKEVARHLLLNVVPPPGTPAARQLPRPRTMLFAARVGGATMRACAPLLELLDIAPILERWSAAAESALVHDTNPWGFNAVRRCIRCKRDADGRLPPAPPSPQGRPTLKLRFCANCKLATYCSSECQQADWAAHKEMCRFTVSWKKDRRGGLF